MATASLLAERPTGPFIPSAASTLQRRGAPLDGRDCELAPAVVHVVHPDREAALDLARTWTCTGITTRVHSTLQDFMQTMPTETTGCLILHVSADTPWLMRNYPFSGGSLPVIVTVDKSDIRSAVIAIKAGAIDFLEMPLDGRDIVDAIDAAIAADRVRREARARQAILLSRFATLTRREREVMALVTRGLLNKQVAGDLGLSEITVKVHRGSVMRKMQARTLADLVRMGDALARCSEIAAPVSFSHNCS